MSKPKPPGSPKDKPVASPRGKSLGNPRGKRTADRKTRPLRSASPPQPPCPPAVSPQVQSATLALDADGRCVQINSTVVRSVIAALARAPDPDEGLRRALLCVCPALDADGGSIALVQNKKLVFRAAQGWQHDPVERELAVRIGQGLIGRAALGDSGPQAIAYDSSRHKRRLSTC